MASALRRWLALFSIALTLTVAAPASAQSYTGGPVPNVGAVDVGHNSHASGHNSHASGHNTHASGHNTHASGHNTHASGHNTHAVAQGRAPVRLALTGGDVVGLVVIGLLSVGIGTVVVRASKRRSLA